MYRTLTDENLVRPAEELRALLLLGNPADVFKEVFFLNPKP